MEFNQKSQTVSLCKADGVSKCRAPCRELALQLLWVPTATERGHFRLIVKDSVKSLPWYLASLQLQENFCAYLRVLGMLSRGIKCFLLKHFCN